MENITLQLENDIIVMRKRNQEGICATKDCGKRIARPGYLDLKVCHECGEVWDEILGRKKTW